MRKNSILLVIVSASLFLAAAASLLAEPAGSPAEAREILNKGSYWKWHQTITPPTVSAEALRAAGRETTAPALLPVKKPWREVPGMPNIQTSPPPADWMKSDFDDTDWPISQGPFEGDVQMGLFCIRGRFQVSDKAAVKSMTLHMTYCGGAIVYLNGREAARVSMPPGEVRPDTSADAYPDEAFQGTDGKVLPTPRQATGEAAKRIASRKRASDALALPLDALRNGVNVLAIEFHRSPFHPIALTWWNTSDYAYGRGVHWAPIGLSEVKLTVSGGGVAPNLLRPAGTQVWVEDIHRQITLDDYGQPQAGDRPLRIEAARNGVFSAKAVVAADKAMSGLQATIDGDLAAVQGAARIPVSATQVRYGVEGSICTGLSGMTGRLDGLSLQPPGELKPRRRDDYRLDRARRDLSIPTPLDGVVQSIWVSVRVPADAAPGDYRGRVTVRPGESGKPVTLPLELHVADWTLPDPDDFRTHVGLFQSPTSLAMHYKVAEWSEPHWAMVEKSLALLGGLGCNLVNIPISDQTQFGNDEGMVYFIRKKDGGFDYDFTVFDRYMALVKKHLGKPAFVALQVWHAGAWKAKPADEPNTVTVVDPATGKRSHLQVPVFGTEESKQFWKPVLDAARAHLAKVDMADAMCIGILSDGTAPPEVFKMFAEIAPGVGWTRGCHTVTREEKPYGLPGGGQVVYHEYCYGGGVIDPHDHMPNAGGYQGPGTDWRRGYRDFWPPITFRRMPERSLYAETRGIGRLGLDYFLFEKEAPGGRVSRQHIFNRWPHSSVAGHGEPTILAMAHPGPDGPMATTRLELMREGIQEAEAVILLADALRTQKDKLGAELAERCRQVLLDRIAFCRMMEIVEDGHAGWQERSRNLYETAAEVGRTLAAAK